MTKRPIRPRAALRDEQRFIADTIGAREGTLIVSGMGSGKTAATLTAMVDNSVIKRWLVIAPLRVARDTWSDEVAEWEHLKGLDYAICVGSPEARRYALGKNAKVTIINRENVVWLSKELGSVENWPWDGVVCDESSMFKNPKKRTTKTKAKKADGTVIVRKGGKQTAFGVLSTARKKIKKVVLLTGTPGELIDLYGQVYLIDKGERLGGTFEDFKARWFDENKYSREIKARPYAHDDIMERIKDIMVSIPPRQLVEPPVHIPVMVQLPPTAMAEYKRFKRTLVSELHDVEAVNAGVLTNKLLQYCIRKDTAVLTIEGWVPIQHIRADSLIWDGDQWVNCEGVLNNGIRDVVTCWGVDMTDDHKVLTTSGWRTAKEILYGDASGGLSREKVRLPNGYSPTWDKQNWQKSDLGGPMRLRERTCQTKPVTTQHKSTNREIMRMSTRCLSSGWEGDARHDEKSPFSDMDFDAQTMSRFETQGLSKLGWTWDRYAGRMVQFFRRILAGCSSWLLRQFEYRQTEQQCVVQQVELSMGDCGDAGEQSTQHDYDSHPVGDNAPCPSREEGWIETYHCEQTVSEGLSRRMAFGTSRDEVYDLINCGPRNRYVVMGSDGPLIVHNCGGSMYREDRTIAAVHTAKLDALDDLIEQANGEPVLIFYGFQFSKDEILKRHPDAVVFNECDTAIKDWNEGRIKKLLMHPRSGGHGTNLQYGGHIAIWFDLTWSLELYMQANARLPRPGQKNIVAIYKILAEGTVDERVVEALDNKETNQAAIIKAVEAEIVADVNFDHIFS